MSNIERAQGGPLAKQEQGEWFDRLYAEDSQYWLTVTAQLNMLAKAGLASKIKVDLSDVETIGLYVIDLKHAGITISEIGLFSHDVRRVLTFFPSSIELARAYESVKNVRKPRHIITDAAWIVEDGIAKVVSLAAVENSGITTYRTERDAQVAAGLAEPMKALPAGNAKRIVSEWFKKLESKVTNNNKLPAYFPCRDLLFAKGIASLYDLRTKGIPDGFDELDRMQIEKAVEADHVRRYGVAADELTQIELEMNAQCELARQNAIARKAAGGKRRA